MITLKLTPVKSSQISAIGYEEPAKKLVVQFISGGTYQYSNVTAKQHASIMAADSVGKALGPIKSNPKAYPFKKVTEAA